MDNTVLIHTQGKQQILTDAYCAPRRCPNSYSIRLYMRSRSMACHISLSPLLCGRLLSLSLSLSIPFSLPPRACLRISYLRMGVSALPLSCSLFSFPSLALLVPGPSLAWRACPTLLRCYYANMRPAPEAVRARTFALTASHAGRAPFRLLVIPLPRVTRPSRACVCVSLSRLRCFLRTLPGRSPG